MAARASTKSIRKSILAKSAKKPSQMRFRRTLFWDVNPKKIDPEKHARYIIERILEFGNDEEIQWLFSYYPHVRIKEAMKRSRGVLHDKTKALWSLVLR